MSRSQAAGDRIWSKCKRQEQQWLDAFALPGEGGARRDRKADATEFRANVNVKDNKGKVPLHLAVNKGCVDIAKLLVTEFGADMDTAGSDGWHLCICPRAANAVLEQDARRAVHVIEGGVRLHSSLRLLERGDGGVRETVCAVGKDILVAAEELERVSDKLAVTHTA